MLLASIHGITVWHWVAFVAVVLFFLALDLGVFHRSAHVVKFREALSWTFVWFCLAMLFAWGLVAMQGREKAMEFIAGYVIELSLSMDNVFVIALIFSFFGVPTQLQHRVLFWGILGALIMRGAMIGMGAALIQQFHSILYFFGAFLVYTGIKMAVAKEEGVHPEKNIVIRFAKKIFPVTSEFHGQNFLVKTKVGTMLTPLSLVLLMVETTDLVFAVDSIPAIFAVTQDAFIVFTSNVFAILGLRSLYFVLAGAMAYFRFLKIGLAVVLVFVGAKMLIVKWCVIPVGLSLAVVGGILLVAIGSSLIAGFKEKVRKT